MTDSSVDPVPWTERAAARSPLVHRSRARSIEQAQTMVDAARRLIAVKGERFTTQELVKEAGVALQTFYRHFEGKDHLLLAVMEDIIIEGSSRFEAAARELENPLERLRFYVTGFLRTVRDEPIGPRFITAEHWRLHQLFPEEMTQATKPVTDLLLREILDAKVAGLIDPPDPERAAWLTTKLIMATYHHYAFATEESAADVAEDVWLFCLSALGGPAPEPPPPPPKGRRRAKVHTR